MPRALRPVGPGPSLVESAFRKRFIVDKCALSTPANEQGVDGDFNVTIDGWQAVPALQEWMSGGRGYWLQNVSYPCSDCCSGGN